MYSVVVPASNNQITFVRIGNCFNYPSMEDMENIRKWVMSNKDTWLSHRKELSNIFGYDIKIKIFPACNSDNKYVWMIARADGFEYPASSEDTQTWASVFSESVDDPDFMVFTWGGFSIKRLNKVLIPFL